MSTLTAVPRDKIAEVQQIIINARQEKIKTTKTDNTPHPNPLPQGAREQGVDKNDGKKTYIQPKTEEVALESSDDIMASNNHSFAIPYRVKSKYQDDFHCTGNQIYIRKYIEYKQSGLSIDDMAKKWYGDAYNNLTKDDLVEFGKYLDRLEQKIKDIDASFEQVIPALIPMTYYRGMILKQGSRELEEFINAKVGDTIQPDLGYSWASPKKNYADDYAEYCDGSSSKENCVVMKIKTPAGSKLSRDVDIDLSEFEFHGLNPYSSMNVVFKRGVSYKVLKKEVIDNKIYVTVKYLGNIDTPSTVTKSSTVNSKPELPSEKIKLPYIKPETKVDLTPETKAQVKDAVQNIRNNYRASFDQIKADLKAMGLDDIGNMSIRLKGEQSLYDKIANYMLEHKGATLEDAIKDVRDAIGARTVVESGKFANHPEVKALLDAGKEREAMLRAAELQSEPAVESLKSEILKQEQNNNHLVTARISNYVSPDGIPYLSENQLADLKQFAANHGVKLKINLRIDPSDPNFSKIDENYKPTTKSQPSGYTALQVNFITKDGKIIEWQFRGDKVNEFAEGEHIPYDLRTGKNIIGEHKELEELYNPFIDMLSENNMKKETYKEYNRYLSDYYTHLRKLELGFDSVEPKLEDYGKGFKFDERLSAKNLIVLHETAEKIKNKVLSVKDAINEYNSKININRIEKFAGSVQPYTNFVVQNQEKIKELNKIQDMEEFCKQSFELIKNEMGLKDSGVKLAFAKGNEGGYYDLESNTVYVNKNWNGTKCVEGQGNKAEIFGDIAHELTHHIQWIEIMRNGWFEDDLGSAYKQQLLKSKEGKYIYNYASKIGSNENSFETSMSQLWNWLNYKDPYKKGQNGFVSDRNGNPIVDKNSSEYKEYINQPVEKDAFEKGKAVIKKYKELID